MTQVEVYTLTGRPADYHLKGTIAFDGRRFVFEPPGVGLENLLAEAVQDPVTRQPVHATENPERWLDCLPYTYRGTYLRVVSSAGTTRGTSLGAGLLPGLG